LGKKGAELMVRLGISFEPTQHLTARAVNGNLLEIKGKVNLDLFWDGYPVSVECLVIPSIAQDLILGFDFWEKVQLSLDLSTLSFSFLSEGVRICVPTTTSADAVHVVAAEVATPIPDADMPVFEVAHPDLNEAQKSEILEVVKEAYRVAPKGLGKTHAIKHSFEFKPGKDKAINQRQFPLSFAAWDSIKKIVQEWVDTGVIERSESPWNLPIFLVRAPRRVGRIG